MTVVTISGLPGSGKTTVAKLLEEKTGLRYVYSGDIFRKLAKKHCMSLEEFGCFCEDNEDVDRELDDYQLKVLREDNVILEGRIAGWIAYNNNVESLKIFIKADLDTRVNRVIKRENGDFDKRKSEIVKRERSEAFRYKNYYGIDVSDFSIYDLVIDSSDKTPLEIVEIILQDFNK